MDNSNLPPSEPPVPPPMPPPPAAPPPLAPPPRWPQPPRRRNGWKVAAIILAILLFFCFLSQMGTLAGWLLGLGGAASRTAGPRLEEVVVESRDSDNKIAIVPVEGIIWGSFDLGGQSIVSRIQEQLKAAGRDARVKAVLLKVNSPGGEVLAADDIYRALAEFQKKTGKPVVTVMGSLAASGGYYVASASRWIVANELTITGSIGVIMHGWNYRSLMNKIGLQPMVYKSGRFKDMLSGERDLEKMTPEEKADYTEETKMVQGLIDQTYQRFKQVVAEGRQNANRLNQNRSEAKGQPLSKSWTDYADGRVLSGKQAYDLGFVDELGTWETAVKRSRELAGISDANLVTYQPIFDLSSLFRMFGKTEAPKLKVDFGMDLPGLEPGHLYFLSPTYLR